MQLWKLSQLFMYNPYFKLLKWRNLLRFGHHDRLLLLREVVQDPVLRGSVPADARLHLDWLDYLHLLGLVDLVEGTRRLRRA